MATPPELLTTAAILLGFELTAFAWRIQREIFMARRDERTWLPLADWAILLAVLFTGLGLLLSLLEVEERPVRFVIGIAILCVVAYPFALAGHYDLYRPISRPCGRPWRTDQESIAVSCLLLAAGAFTIWFWGAD